MLLRLCISRSPRRVNTMAMKLAMILTKAVDDDGDHEDGGDDYSFSDDDAAVEDDDDKLKMIMMMMAMVLVLVRMGVRYCPLPAVIGAEPKMQNRQNSDGSCDRGEQAMTSVLAGLFNLEYEPNRNPTPQARP